MDQHADVNIQQKCPLCLFDLANFQLSIDHLKLNHWPDMFRVLVTGRVANAREKWIDKILRNIDANSENQVQLINDLEIEESQYLEGNFAEIFGNDDISGGISRKNDRLRLNIDQLEMDKENPKMDQCLEMNRNAQKLNETSMKKHLKIDTFHLKGIKNENEKNRVEKKVNENLVKKSKKRLWISDVYSMGDPERKATLRNTQARRLFEIKQEKYEKEANSVVQIVIVNGQECQESAQKSPGKLISCLENVCTLPKKSSKFAENVPKKHADLFIYPEIPHISREDSASPELAAMYSCMNPPKLVNSPPKLVNSPPKLVNSPPKLVNSPPKLVNSPPKLVNSSPKLVNSSPPDSPELPMIAASQFSSMLQIVPVPSGGKIDAEISSTSIDRRRTSVHSAKNHRKHPNLTCQECKANGIYNIRRHILARHLQKPLFFCPHCPYFNMSRKSSAVSHIRLKHKSEKKPKDKSANINSLVSKWKSKCFPKK